MSSPVRELRDTGAPSAPGVETFYYDNAIVRQFAVAMMVWGVVAFLVSPPARMMNGTIIDYEQVPFGTFDAHPALGPE